MCLLKLEPHLDRCPDFCPQLKKKARLSAKFLSLLFLLFDVNEPCEGIYLFYRKQCGYAPSLVTTSQELGRAARQRKSLSVCRPTPLLLALDI